MNSAGISSLLAAVILALSVPATADANDTPIGSWPLSIGEESSILENPTFVNHQSETDSTVSMSAATGGSPSVGDSDGDPERPGDNTLSGTGSPLPSVPLPAPVLLAGIGLAGLILCRNRIGKLMR